MVDIHCHILPGFDDGAGDLEESLAMLRLARDSGVTELVATPHFPGRFRTLGELSDLTRRFEALQAGAQQQGLDIRLHPGAEILFLPETVRMAREQCLPTLGRTRYVLLEFYFDTPAEVMNSGLDAIAARGYRPVIAHPERYEAIGADPRWVERWFRRDYVVQLNKGSVLGAFGQRVQKNARWILDRGLAHVVASDAHSARRRTTDLSLVAQRIGEAHSAEYAAILLEENPKRLVRGLDMLPVE